MRYRVDFVSIVAGDERRGQKRDFWGRKRRDGIRRDFSDAFENFAGGNRKV